MFRPKVNFSMAQHTFCKRLIYTGMIEVGDRLLTGPVRTRLMQCGDLFKELRGRGFIKGHNVRGAETKELSIIREPAANEASSTRGMNESNNVHITIPQNGSPSQQTCWAIFSLNLNPSPNLANDTCAKNDPSFY